MTPLILNQVASVAEAVDDIALGTANGPTRLGPLLRVMSAASTMVRVEGPPEPMMMPVRSLEISLVFEAGVADRLLHGDVVPGGAAAEEAHGAAVDATCRIERRRAVHLAAEAELGVFVGARRCPDLASRRLASTSCVLLPMDETMPIPVTTTRLMPTLRSAIFDDSAHGRRDAGRPSAAARLQHLVLLNRPTLRSMAR